MRVQMISGVVVRGVSGTAARWIAISAAAAVLAACGTTGAAAAGPTKSSAATTLSYYAFDINNDSTDRGFIAVPGDNHQVFAQGDQLIINDQLTSTSTVGDSYPIVGYDTGLCTLARIPEPRAEQTLEICVVTAVWRTGSLTVQGVVSFQSMQPRPAVLAVTGGTGRLDGAAGTVAVSFTKSSKILTLNLRSTPWRELHQVTTARANDQPTPYPSPCCMPAQAS
jgi:hypothetical protein